MVIFNGIIWISSIFNIHFNFTCIKEISWYNKHIKIILISIIRWSLNGLKAKYKPEKCSYYSICSHSIDFSVISPVNITQIS